ncbi:MAG: hypothetical protein E7282_03550 [Lachnospiraceae bacterium]|nr:hypothetical protein [Lachnospiraceae bacterium]
MAESLLAHLYSRIKGSQEDVATMSLQYIISSSNRLNQAFNRLLSDALKFDLDEDITYSCQSVGENSERPDMSGVDKNGNEVILCEMKFYAGLTSNQPNGYLDRLVNENGKALVFVCPERRRVSLWNKLTDLCREANREFSAESNYRAEVDGIVMAIISWAEIIEMLRRTAASQVIEAISDIEQLSGFCDMMDSTAFIPFASEDMGPDIARREDRYFQVIDRLFDTLIANKSLKASGKGLKSSPNRNGYIKYLKINQYAVALIYDRSTWIDSKSAETPFWFYFNDDGWTQTDELKKKLVAIPEYERAMFGNTIGIALHPMLDSQLDEIAVNLMNQILGIISKVEE